MAKLVKCRAIPVDGLMEERLRRHRDIVTGRRIKGLAATDAEVRPAVSDQAVGLGDRHQRPGQLRHMGQLVRQPFTLIDIEDGEALEKRNRPCLAILLAGSLYLGLGDEPIRIADDAPLLALADMAASRLGLPIGQPALPGKAALNDRCPQDQDIDARVAPPGDGILRHGAGTGAAVPWLHPGKMPRFQFRDDPGGDFAIDALTLGIAHVPHSFFTPQPAPEGRRRVAGAVHQRRRERRPAPAGPQ